VRVEPLSDRFRGDERARRGVGKQHAARRQRVDRFRRERRDGLVAAQQSAV